MRSTDILMRTAGGFLPGSPPHVTTPWSHQCTSMLLSLVILAVTPHNCNASVVSRISACTRRRSSCQPERTFGPVTLRAVHAAQSVLASLILLLLRHFFFLS